MSNVSVDNGNSTPIEDPVVTSQRWKRIGTTLARFFSLQLVTQALLALSGIILVRTLSKTEYGYFTITNTVQGTMNLLADSGISIGVMSIGGKVWHDKYRFGQLINSALFMRKRVAIAVVLTVAPIALWTLHSNGASTFYAAILVGTVLTALNAQITIGVLEVVPRLRSQFMRFSQLDLALAAVRLFLVYISYLLFSNAVISIMIGSTTLIAKTLVLKMWSAEGIEKEAPISFDDQKELSLIIKRQAPGVMFFCLQGQITTWLLSYFGSVGSIAEIGALSGLTVVFGLINSLTTNVVVPKFARIQQVSALKSFYWRTLLSYSFVFLILLALARYAPNQILWLLGKKYQHLQKALMLMVLSSVFSNLIGIIWSLNAARAWIQFSWLNIPLTLILQVVILCLMRVNNTYNAIIFGLLSVIPNLVVNIFLSHYGFKNFAKERGQAIST